jgi:hypothetical protein
MISCSIAFRAGEPKEHATQREVPLSATKHPGLTKRGVEHLPTIRLGTTPASERSRWA